MYQTTTAGGANLSQIDARKGRNGQAKAREDLASPSLAHPDTVALNVLADGAPTVHHMTRIVRNANEPEAETPGVVSLQSQGPCQYARGSCRVFKEGAPAQRLTSVTAHNGVNMNAPGVALVPSQLTVLVNS
jgi:hypothetical protein